MPFRIDPSSFISGDRRGEALANLQEYAARYAGSRFEVLRDTDHPDEFTARDMVAVQMLSVSVPAKVAIWLLHDGRELVREQLSKLPADVPIWEAGGLLARDGPAWALWRLVQGHRWGDVGMVANGVGRTTASKLLASKRPHLIPIYDQHVGAALMHRPSDDYWEAWQACMSGPSGERLRDEVESLRREARLADGFSVLRVLDIVVWMSVHGSNSARAAV